MQTTTIAIAKILTADLVLSGVDTLIDDLTQKSMAVSHAARSSKTSRRSSATSTARPSTG